MAPDQPEDAGPPEVEGGDASASPITGNEAGGAPTPLGAGT